MKGFHEEYSASDASSSCRQMTAISSWNPCFIFLILFQRTKITAATIPIIDRQNGNTIDTASTMLRFSTLFARGLALPATDPLDTGAVIAVCLEVFSVGVTVVKLFGLFVFSVDCSKVDVVFCKLGLVYVVPLFSRVGVDEVDKASFSVVFVLVLYDPDCEEAKRIDINRRVAEVLV